MSKARRDEMIIVAMDALQEIVVADASTLYIDAALVVDALLARYRVKPKKPNV